MSCASESHQKSNGFLEHPNLKNPDHINASDASEPTDVLNVRIVFWIFLVFIILVLILIFLVNVPVALWAHLRSAHPLSAGAHAEMMIFDQISCLHHHRHPGSHGGKFFTH